MAVNPYVIPARYQYTPLPANFLLEAGMRKQNQFDTANANIEAFKTKLAVEPGYLTTNRAKELENKYLSQVQPLVDEFYKTGDVQSIIPKLSKIQSQFQQDPERRAIQSDFELKPLAAKVLSDPTLMDRGYHTLYDENGQLRQSAVGEEINPSTYGVIPEATLRSSFDPYANEIKPEIIKTPGQPTKVKVGEDEEGKGIYKIATKNTTVNQLVEEYFRNQFNPLTESGRYKETPFYQWYSKKHNTDVSPQEMRDLLVNEYATKFFQQSDTDLNLTSLPKEGANGDGSGNQEVPFMSQRTTENLEFVNAKTPFDAVRTSKDALKTLTDLSNTYNPEKADAELSNQGYVGIQRDSKGYIDNSPEYVAKFADANNMNIADARKLIFEQNANKSKSDSYAITLGTLQDDLNKLKEVHGISNISAEDKNTLDIINEIKNNQPGVMTGLKTLLKSTVNRYFDASTFSPEDVIGLGEKSYSDYVSIALRPKGYYDNVSEEDYKKAEAVLNYSENANKFSKIENAYSKYKDDENKLIKDKLAPFNESVTAFRLQDEGTDKWVRPEDKQLALNFNKFVKSGNARGVDPNADSPDYATDNALKANGKGDVADFSKYVNDPNWKFNPDLMFFKEGKAFIRGQFEPLNPSEDGPYNQNSQHIDIDATNFLKDKLPLSAELQQQVFANISNQLQYIPPGEKATINILGNEAEVVRGTKENSNSIDIGKGAFFTFDENKHTMGMNETKVNFKDASEASYQIMQGLIKQEQLKGSYPQLFNKRSDGSYYYNGKNTPTEVEDRKELVSSLATTTAARFGKGEEWGDYLTKLIGFESAGTYDPGATNTTDPTDHPAKGLIQFKPSEKEYVNEGGKKRFYKEINGTKYFIDDLENMSLSDQMLFPVADYIGQYIDKMESPQEMYIAVIQPALFDNPTYQKAKTIEDKRKLVIGNLITDDRFYNSNKPLFKKDATLEEMKKHTLGEILDKVYNAR